MIIVVKKVIIYIPPSDTKTIMDSLLVFLPFLDPVSVNL